MHRTPSSASNRDKWTWSGWIKRGNISANLQMFSAPLGSSSGYMSIQYGSADQFMLYQWNGSGYDFDVRTTQVFRDPSAWYHYVVVYDSGNDISSERVKLYVNGQRITDLTGASSSPAYPSQNTDSYLNNTVQHSIGYYTRPPSSGGQYFDGYMTEMVFIDGQALDPSSFGEYNDSNIWIPKDVSGLTFGTNGFHIDGRDSSDLGDDESGNGNDFTTSGLGTHDQVSDSPTNNFCVLNPISIPNYGGNFNRGVAETNLAAYNAGGAETYAIGTMPFSSGKWYWEFYTTSYPAGNGIVYGITEQDYWEQNGTTSHSYIGKRAGLSERHTTSAYSYWAYNTTSISASGLTPFQQGVVVGTAVDMSTNTITFTTNGSAYASKDFDDFSYAFGSNAQFPVWRLIAATTLNVNFGQDSTFNGQVTAGGNSDANGVGNFKYSVPSGYLALCTKNLGS